MAGTGIDPDKFTTYGDTNAAASRLAFPQGWDAMAWFIEGTGTAKTPRRQDGG